MLNKTNLEKKAAAAAKKLGLTNEEVKQLQSCAYGLYSGELGGDMPASKKDGTCSRAEIMEVICDANRLELEVSRSCTIKGQVFNAKAFKDYNLLLDLIGPAFLATRYEVGQPYEVW